MWKEGCPGWCGRQRRADRLVGKGIDIPDAAKLFAVMQKTETTTKLFFVNEEAVEKAVLEMPNDVPPVTSTRRMHQAVKPSPWRTDTQGRQMLVQSITKPELF